MILNNYGVQYQFLQNSLYLNEFYIYISNTTKQNTYKNINREKLILKDEFKDMASSNKLFIDCNVNN